MKLKEIKKNGNLSNLIIILSCVFVFIVTAIVSTVQLLSKGTYSSGVDGYQTMVSSSGTVFCREYSNTAGGNRTYGAIVDGGNCGGSGGGIFWNATSAYDEYGTIETACAINGMGATYVIFNNFKIQEVSTDIIESVGMISYELLGVDTYTCVACGGKLSDTCKAKLKEINGAAWYPGTAGQGADVVNWNPTNTLTTDELINQDFIENSSWQTNSITRLATSSVDKPTADAYCQNGLTYNGNEQTLTKAPGNGYTFTNNKKTNAGTYDVVAKLNEGFKWSDDTTEDVIIKCSIGKAEPVVSINPDTITMPVGDKTVIDGNANIDGTYSSTSANTNVATTSDGANNKITINGISKGNTVVRIKFTPSDEENYNSVIVPVNVIVTDNSNGNIDVNPPTGTNAIMFVWIIGIATIGYAYWYFKKNFA